MNDVFPATRLRISVLICTADRPRLLDRALRSLASGSQCPDQLVIVNGGGEDANRVVETYASRFRDVVLLHYANRNLSTSRNLGLPHCDGDIIALTDDDAEVSPDWISQIERVHRENARVGAIGGPVDGAHNDRFLSRVADRVVFPSHPKRLTVRTLPGVNVAYKRQAVEAVGGFDESLFRGEDVDFNWRVSRSGYSLIYDPAIRVTHAHRSTFRGLVQQQYMYGRAYVLVRRKWPDMYCVYPHHLRTLHSWAKLLHCGFAIVYQPALAAARMDSRVEGLAAYPILVVHHLVWKVGMLRQAATRARVERDADCPVSTTSSRHWRYGQLCDQEQLEQSIEGLEIHPSSGEKAS